MSDDIENTINSFLIDAAAMRAALDVQGEKVALLTEALQRAAVENQRARKALADMVASGVHQQAAQKIAEACRPLVASITTAAGRAEQAITDKLADVERSQAHGWLASAGIACAAGMVASAATLAFVRFVPAIVGIYP